MTPADPSRVVAAFEIISQTARKALLSKFVSKKYNWVNIQNSDGEIWLEMSGNKKGLAVRRLAHGLFGWAPAEAQ